MEVLKKTTRIDFLGKRRTAAAISGLLVLLSLLSLLTRGLNFGIDFTGGTLLEVGYSGPVELGEIRGALSESGFKDAVVQHFGSARDVLIRVAPHGEKSSADLSAELLDILSKHSDASVEMRRVEFVGPQVGEELVEAGGLAMLWALGAIVVYVWLRFERRFALGAVTALIHDVVITLGIFSIFRFDFDLTVVAALLAVIGYSLNDTIVVFDRIRENFRKIRKGTVIDVINRSINETLSRTLMTSFTTLLVLFSLFIFGGEVIRYFALALIIGIVVGTYSSIYVASAAALRLGVSREDLMPVQKEGAGLSDRP